MKAINCNSCTLSHVALLALGCYIKLSCLMKVNRIETL